MSGPHHRARRVVIVAFEDVQLLDVAGPLEVFTGANLAAGRPTYRVEVAAVGPGVRTSSGLAIETVPLRSVRPPVDTLVVAGGTGAMAHPAPAELVAQLHRLVPRARRVASVCSGALILAATGVLDGRRATTHWATAATLARRYPAVSVDAGPIYLRDGEVWTSAGVTAGIDLSLAMVAEDVGADVANDVARWLVLPGRRSGSQAQFNPRLASAARAEGDSAVNELVAWARAHLAGDLSLPALALRAHLSERQLSRRFKAATGQTVSAFVEAARLDQARELLETTGLDLATIARRCGFGHRETFHRAFAKRFGTTPARHRAEFGELEEFEAL